MAFLDLPPELIEKVLTFVHPMEVVLLRSTSKAFRDLIDASAELALRIELAVDGFLLRDRGDIGAKTLLDQILARRQAFDEFRPLSEWTVRSETHTDDHKFEVADGIWAVSDNDIPDGDDMTFRELNFEELVHPDHPGGKWSLAHKDLGQLISDVGIYLEQDLMTLLERRDERSTWRLHFRKLSNNTDHPLAARPYIDFHQESSEYWKECEMNINDEIIVLDFYDRDGPMGTKRTGFIVLDWIEGRTLIPYTPAYEKDFLPQSFLLIYDVTLLTKHYIALLCSKSQGNLSIEVRDVRSDKALYNCLLPISTDTYRPRFLKRPASNGGPNCPTGITKLLAPDPMVQIVAMVAYNIVDNSRHTMVFLVHRFLHQCDLLSTTFTSTKIESPLPPTFQWEEWGPLVTRWLPLEVRGWYGSRMMFGSRMLALYSPSRRDFPLFDTLLDFNPRPIRRGWQAWAEEDAEAWFVTGIRELIMGSARVTSSLPYRQWISWKNMDFANLVLDANTIIARKSMMYHCFSFLPNGDYSQTQGGPRPL